MTRRCVLLLSILVSTATVCAAASPVSRVKVRFDTPERLRELSRLASIEDVEDGIATISLLDHRISSLEAAGFNILPWSPEKIAAPQMCPEGWQDLDIPLWNCYPTYEQYAAMMERLGDEFSDICRLVDLGPTANLGNPHRILALEITDNPDVEEIEPEVFLTSTMHGDETAGFVLLLRLAFHLASGYGQDAELTALVDSTEIWINPLANPDGTYFGGNHTVESAIRYYTTNAGNSTSVDPNRNFPDRFKGRFPSGAPWWPETEAMMAFAADHTITISANLHGGSEVVNYPWDGDCGRHPDDAWLFHISSQWAHAAQEDGPAGYFDDCKTPLCGNYACTPGVTHGADWYPVFGGRQDFMTYFHRARELTVEISRSKLLPETQLDGLWQAQERALIGFLDSARIGIHGRVTDSLGNPLRAWVSLVGHDRAAERSAVLSDPDAGDFHRPTLPGTYTVAIAASGFKTEILEGITVGDEDSSVFLEVELSRMPVPDPEGTERAAR